MPSFKVRLFAAHRESAGKSSVTIRLGEGSRVRDARAALQREEPALAPGGRGTTVIAVNGQYADDDLPLRAGDEIAAFPPVAGG